MSRLPVPLTFRIYRDDNLVREETLTQPVIKIGKLSSSHLRLDDEQVSRMHAVIESNAAGECSIIDLGSTRGTIVNGQKINKATLRSGDVIELGGTRIEVSLAHAAPVDAKPAAARIPVAPASAAVRVTPSARMSPPAPASFTAARATAPAVSTPIFGADAAVPATGDRAIEIAAMLGDSVVEVKHLSDPHTGRVSRTTYALFLGGAAMLLLAGLAFFAGVNNAEFNKASKQAWIAENQAAHDWRPQIISPAFDWMAFGGLAAGLIAMTCGLVRVRNERVSPYFRIGSDAGVEFPTDAAPSQSFALIAPRGDDFVFNFTRDMDGELAIGGASTSLAEVAAQGRARPSESAPGALEMAIPEHARIKLSAGQNTFLISSVPRPKKQVMPLLGSFESRAFAFFAASAVVHMGLWAFLNTLPPSPASLSMDFSDRDARITRIATKPNEEPPEDTKPAEEPSTDSGGTGTAMALESGKLGTDKSQRESGRYAMEKTSDTSQIAKEQATAQAREAGVLGVLKRQRGGAFSSITGTGDFSSGLDDGNVFGGLLGDEAGAMNGGFGFGTSGFGPGGGGTGWGTVGTGSYGTIGQGNGTGEGYATGGGRGLDRNRKPAAPSVQIGHAVPSGGLDKNIIRRLVRQRLPRIKYCYEKQLLVNPGLSGTILSDFQVTPQGVVIASSAKGVSEEVSSCVADVISSIQFPKPKNGLMVQVKYPFTFRPSGG